MIAFQLIDDLERSKWMHVNGQNGIDCWGLNRVFVKFKSNFDGNNDYYNQKVK